MFYIYTIRADYEGWWLFDDWREKIVSCERYGDEHALQEAYTNKLNEMRQRYPNEILGKHDIHAFYTNCEIEFCEACDEDMQIYHSVIVMENDRLYYDKVKFMNP